MVSVKSESGFFRTDAKSNVVETLLFILRSSMSLRKRVIVQLPVGGQASKSVIADDKGLHDLLHRGIGCNDALTVSRGG